MIKLVCQKKRTTFAEKQITKNLKSFIMTKSLRFALMSFMMLLYSTAFAETVTFESSVDKGNISDYNSAGYDEITKNGVKISISSGMLGYGSHYRIYKGQTMTVSSTAGTITNIDITCIVEGAEKYGPGCFTDPTTGSYTYNGIVGTWSGAASSITLTASGAQVRATKITVTYSTSAATKKAANMSFSKNSVETVMGQTFTAPTLTKETTAAVTYKSDNASVATVDATSGAVTIVGPGTAVITATAEENAEYYSGTASYTIKVKSVDVTNTPETAYTVAKVKELIATGETFEDPVYIKGIITQVVEINLQYGNATYYINDTDSKDGQLSIYRGLYLDGEKFTATGQIIEGDEVVIYGVMSTYKEEPQIAQGNKIVSIKKGSGTVVDIKNTPETAYTVAKANELITAGEGLVNSVYVKGVITKINEVSTSYGNAEFYINDTNSEEGQLMTYHCYYLENEKFTAEDQIAVGDNVIIYGQLKNYNGTYEMVSCYIYSLNGKTTSIENITAEDAMDNGTIYDLGGKVAPASYKGIVIKGGKKFIKK